MEEYKNIFKSYLFIVTNICFVILLGFSSLNFVNGYTSIAYVELGLSLFLLVSSISMFITKKEVIATVVALFVIIALSINNLITGGYQNTGIFWIYALPMVTFFITNTKVASIVSFGFITSMIVIATMQAQEIIMLPYTSTVLYFATSALFVTTIMALIYKKINDLNFERIETLLVQQELFNSILELSSKFRNLQTFADQVITKIVKHFNFDAGILQLHEPGDDFLKAVGSYNVDKELRPKVEKITLSEAIYSKVLTDLKPMYITDFEKVDPIRYKVMKRKTVVMIPLTNRGELSGAISLGSNQKKTFTNSDKKVIERIAMEISLLLENVKDEEIIVEKLA